MLDSICGAFHPENQRAKTFSRFSSIHIYRYTRGQAHNRHLGRSPWSTVPSTYSPHHAEGLVNPIVRAQKKVTDFVYHRACRFRKHQIENMFPELTLPTFFKTFIKCGKN
jgi:hypothetical protein